MTQFVKQYYAVRGVHYPTQKIGDIKYHTGNRVYRVSNIREHFPNSIHIFRRWTKVIYDGQPAWLKQDSNIPQQTVQMESEPDPTKPQQQNNRPKTNNVSESPQIIQETLISQMPKSPTVVDETPVSQMSTATNKHESTIETPITEETAKTQTEPHPTTELTIGDFPSLQKQNQEKHTTKPVLEDEELSDDSMDQSPAIIAKQPIQINFKRPLKTPRTVKNHLH